MELATFAGGCFWCVEAVFQRLNGVEGVVSGYAGGQTSKPNYEQVCSGKSGHAEVIQIQFDPHQISYRQLLEVFFALHDPTTLNRQGADTGSQYRSAIFYHNEEQKREAETVREEVNSSGEWGKPVVTQIAPLTNFYPAEAYHQNYYNENQNQPYCMAVIPPKLQKLEKKFSTLLK